MSTSAKKPSDFDVLVQTATSPGELIVSDAELAVRAAAAAQPPAAVPVTRLPRVFEPATDEVIAALRRCNRERGLGLTEEEYRWMKTDPLKFAPDNGLFIPVQSQVNEWQRWNRDFNLGITEEQFSEALANAPLWPRGELVAPVLVFYSNTLERTMESLLWILKSNHPKLTIDPKFDVGRKKLVLLEGVDFHPGLRWEVVSFGENVGETVSAAKVAPQNAAHVGVFAAMALHRKWVASMNGKEVPFVVVPGLEQVADGNWTHRPCIIQKEGSPHITGTGMDRGLTGAAIVKFFGR